MAEFNALSNSDRQPSQLTVNRIKLVLVGDTAVGKSSLITSYLTNTFNADDYEPTVLDIYMGSKSVNKKLIELEIHDTSGHSEFVNNRIIQYQGCDGFVICCAYDD